MVPHKLRGPLVTILFIAVVHGGLGEILGKVYVFTDTSSQMAAFEQALGVEHTSTQVAVSANSLISMVFYILSLPLGIFFGPSASVIEDVLLSPWYLDALNSLLAASIIYGMLLLVRTALPRPAAKSDPTKLDQFLTGSFLPGSRKKDLPLELLPVFNFASYLKSLEKHRFGAVLLIAVLHLIFGAMARVLESTAILAGTPPGLFAKIMITFTRLPLAPLFVPTDFWHANQTRPLLTNLLTYFNSLLFGVIVLILHRVISVLVDTLLGGEIEEDIEQDGG